MTRRPSPERRSPAAPPPDPHPPADQWWELARGGLRPAEGRRREAHRASCASCDRRAAGAERLARARAMLDLEAPPPSARSQARALFADVAAGGLGRRGPAARPRPDRIRPRHPSFSRLRLVHRFAAACGGAGFASTQVRGATAVEPLRRCALEGGTWRLELEWTPLDHAWAIRGRVVDLGVPPGPAGGPLVRIESADGMVRAVRPGPRGFFGPLRVPSPELRVILEEGERSFRSPWLPRAPRSRR